MDPISLDMSGNGRFRPTTDLLLADQDSAPAIQLGHFNWQPSDRPQGVLISDRSGHLRVQLANSTVSLPIRPSDLIASDIRLNDKVSFRVARAHTTIGPTTTVPSLSSANWPS